MTISLTRARVRILSRLDGKSSLASIADSLGLRPQTVFASVARCAKDGMVVKKDGYWAPTPRVRSVLRLMELPEEAK
jgi:Mn-dependent DtxR family transcriptional regulator